MREGLTDDAKMGSHLRDSFYDLLWQEPAFGIWIKVFCDRILAFSKLIKEWNSMLTTYV